MWVGGCAADPQDINSIYNVLELLQGRARSTEALVMVKLDIARNRILTAGLVFSMASTCLTVGALVSGIFGRPPPDPPPPPFVHVHAAHQRVVAVVDIAVVVAAMKIYNFLRPYWFSRRGRLPSSQAITAVYPKRGT